MSIRKTSKNANTKVKIRELLKKGRTVEQIRLNYPYSKKAIEEQQVWLKNNN